MTEKEKMVSGIMHNPSDPEIDRDRFRAHDLCFRLNKTDPADFFTRTEILEELLPNAARPIRILSPFQCEFGYNITIGEGCTFNYGLMVLDNSRVTFGRHVFMGPRCIFATPMHPMIPKKRNTWQIYALPITVGDNVWIGADVKVLPGVKIGDGAVIGAGSVVVGHIPEMCFAAGNPARVIRKLDRDVILRR